MLVDHFHVKHARYLPNLLHLIEQRTGARTFDDDHDFADRITRANDAANG